VHIWKCKCSLTVPEQFGLMIQKTEIKSMAIFEKLAFRRKKDCPKYMNFLFLPCLINLKCIQI